MSGHGHKKQKFFSPFNIFKSRISLRRDSSSSEDVESAEKPWRSDVFHGVKADHDINRKAGAFIDGFHGKNALESEKEGSAPTAGKRSGPRVVDSHDTDKKAEDYITKFHKTCQNSEDEDKAASGAADDSDEIDTKAEMCISDFHKICQDSEA